MRFFGDADGPGVLSLLKCVVAALFGLVFVNSATAERVAGLCLPASGVSHFGDHDVSTYHCTC